MYDACCFVLWSFLMQNGLVDSFEAITAAALLSATSPRTKVDSLFALYDFAGEGKLGYSALFLLLRTAAHVSHKVSSLNMQ
jgi:hypothetical protein